MTKQLTLLLATLFGMTAVILGAFGAHALKNIMVTNDLNAFETGVKYQMYHALVLLFWGLYSSVEAPMDKNISWLLVIGIVLFSFSIYGLTMGNAFGKSLRFLGPITPIGGTLLIVAWGLMAYRILKG